MQLWRVLATTIFCLTPLSILAGPGDGPDSLFSRSVAPLLAGKCLECHDASCQKGGLDLSTAAGLRKGGDEGPVVIPGEPNASRLYQAVSHQLKPAMPFKRMKLEEVEIEMIARWIKEGAPYDFPLKTPERQSASKSETRLTDADWQFWSFQPLRRPDVPVLREDDWSRNGIDRLLFAKMRKLGLKPSAAASREKLARRIYYDVTGLPPSPAEIADFVADTRLDAYERLVDRLLASSRYGERWARHWLDLARYADSAGYERDWERANAYHYRDFVIKALNQDLPYDQFVRWQLAGDEYDSKDPFLLAATGFCASGPREILKPTEQIRYNELDDILATTGSAMLGLTVGCARCHDHKYDPIPQRDYYRLLACFATGTPGEQWVSAPDERTAYESADLEFQRARLALKRWINDQLGLHGVNSEPALKKKVSREESAQWDALVKRKDQALNASLKYVRKMLVFQDAQARPVETFFLERGDPALKRERVEPGFLSVFDRGAPRSAGQCANSGTRTTGLRRSVAEWMVDTEAGAGSLAARVMVNRLWQHHFGEGLVKTPSDFGFQGDRPEVPELIELLASELVRQGWRLKPLHRLILLSAAYQQSAEKSDKHGIDPENRVWSRRRPQRLEAEAIRDAILSVSGSLNDAMFGPGVRPALPAAVINTGSTPKWPLDIKEGPETWRRSVYIFVKRSVLVPMLDIFDGSNATGSCAERTRTVLPGQALELMNGDFAHLQSERFAAKLCREFASNEGRVRAGFKYALGRIPSATEIKASLNLIEQLNGGAESPDAPCQVSDGWAAFCQVLFNANEFIYID